MMRIHISSHEEFVERFKRSRGFWERAIGTVGMVFLVVGFVVGIPAVWHNTERLTLLLLLAAIGLFTFLCYTWLMGILAELSYLRERLLKETELRGHNT